MSDSTIILPFQPASMSTAQLAAVSYWARYSGHTHALYAYQFREWFSWCEVPGLDPRAAVQRAHVELHIRHLGDRGLMDSSVVTMMHGVRGFFRFAHIDGLIPSDPAVYARQPKVHRDESRTQGLDRLELIRFLQVAQTITVHHGALAYLLGINALRASEAAAVRIDDYAETLRGHRVLHLVGKGTSPPQCRSPSRFCVSSRHAAANEPADRLSCDRSPATPSTDEMSTGWLPGSRRLPASRDTSARTRCGTLRSPTPWTLASRCAMHKSSLVMPILERPSITTAPAATSTDTAFTS